MGRAMLINNSKTLLFTVMLGASLFCISSVEAIAQQVQSNRVLGSFPIDATASCPTSFKKETRLGNQHDPNYNGPDKIYLCVPNRPDKLTDKARQNPLASKSLPFLSLDDFGALQTSVSQDPIREQLSKQEESTLTQLISAVSYTHLTLPTILLV